MARPAGAAFSEAPPEERLLDYARRLGRFRKGRTALRLKISLLGREYRQERYLRQAEAPLKPLIGGSEGEIFRLETGDIVCVAKAPRKSFDTAVLKIIYLLRDDPQLKAAIDRGEELALLCDWFPLESAYQEFLALAEAIHRGIVPKTESIDIPFAPSIAFSAVSASAAAPAAIAGAPKGYAPLVRKRRAMARNSFDADAYARMERAVSTADLAGFLHREPVRLISGDQPLATILQDCAIDLEALVSAIMPGYSAGPEPWFSDRLFGILGDRLLGSEFEIKSEGLTAVLLRLSIDNALGPELDNLLARQSAAQGAKLVIAIAAREAMAHPLRCLKARARLRGAGLRMALVDFDPLQYAMRDRALFPSDFDSIDWRRARAWEAEQTDAYERICRVLKNADPARLILDHCDCRDAVDFGRSLGIMLYAGPYIRTL